MTRDTLDFILKHILLKNFSKLFHQLFHNLPRVESFYRIIATKFFYIINRFDSTVSSDEK